MLKWLFDPIRMTVEAILLGSILLVALMICMALELVKESHDTSHQEDGD